MQTIDTEADDPYLYHFSIEGNSKLWIDDMFRGKRWQLGKSYPHKLLRDKQNSLPSGHAIFFICFYPDYTSANSFEKLHFTNFNTHLLRVPKQSLVDAGFNESWDDGFDEGQVLLFWKADLPNEHATDRSSSGIPLDRVQIQFDRKWIGLTEYRSAMAQRAIASTPLTIVDSSLAPVASKVKARWWKFLG